ncbi:MAG: DUF4355 domain-containing protein [Peptococcaceae bacterium]|nr:DUF4355 domain-containing protein [Peptococcaceae bacterium]
MADDNKNQNLTNPGQDQNLGDGGQGKQDNPPEKTFTQAELEAIIADRLKRERDKYKDYADLKKAAEEYQKLKEAQMSEAEKLKAKLAEYERQLLEKEREAAEARLEALKLRVLDEMGLPKAWANRIFGTTEEEIKQDAEELKRLLGTPGRPVGSGTNPAIAGNQAQIFTREQIKKMSPEEINANWEAIMKQMAAGGIK